MSLFTAIQGSGAPATPAPSGFAFLGETAKAGSDNDTALTDPFDTTGAKLIVVAIGHYTFTAPTLTDSEGNLWTLFSDHGVGGNSHIKLYYCIDPVTAADHTFGTAVASQYASIAAMAFSASAVTAEDEAGDSVVSDEVATGDVTASVNGSLFIAALCSGNAEHDAASVSAGFSTPIQGVAAGDVYNVALSYKIQENAGIENVTWSVPDVTGMSGCLANFLPE